MSATKLFAMVLGAAVLLSAAEHKGKVQFGGLPLPGATITATQGGKSLTAIADADGNFVFPDLPDGMWNFDVEMQGFTPIKQDVTVAGNADIPEFDLKMLSFDEIKATAAPPPPPPGPTISVTQNQETQPAPAGNADNTTTTAPNGKQAKGKKGAAAAAAATPANGQSGFQRAAVNANGAPSGGDAPSSEPAPSGPFAGQSGADLAQRASDGLLINGTTNNGASSPFAQAASFGNNRRGPGSLYNGNLGLIEDTSAFDAKTFSYTGADTPKPYYDHIQFVGNIGGPLRIPHLLTNGPQFFVNYAMIRNHNAQTNTYEVPTAEQRAGNFAAYAPVWDPTSGAPFAGNIVPPSRISPQAQALMNFFPQPNVLGSSLYNYQIPVVGELHQDQLRAQLNKNVGNRNFFYGYYAFQRQAQDNPSLTGAPVEYGFLDKNGTLGQNTQINWQHRVGQRMFEHFQVSFSRYSSTTNPYFANRENVSGLAGITGNIQDPINWGPPTLNFSDGINPLGDGIYGVVHNQTTGFTYDTTWSRGRHEITWGGDYKRVQFNSLGQSNPRGAFTFDGAYTAAPGTPIGNDFADFLLGVPDTASVSFGNADKYFRQPLYDAFVGDNWRVGPSLTVNTLIRWDYQAPITELYGRMANIDVAPGYSAIAPVTALDPIGPLTGIHYGDSLMNPDKHEFQPRIGIAWRPIPASSLIIRAGYGVYFNTSVYQTIASQLASQPPFSTSLSVANTSADPLTLARGFVAPPNYVTNTFGIDPNFLVGYAQNYQLSVQRDLPGSLVMTATYLGIKGTRGMQEFLPNSYPYGGVNPCPLCPAGFTYMTSNGNSTRQSGSFQLRRRLHNGFLSSVTYTYAKAIDDSALGGRNQGVQVIAQDWLDLSAERALSNFDQRQNVAFQAQYTSGQGIGGGTLLSGWRGALLKEWTIATTINAGTGLPQTPYDLLPSGATGVTAQQRADYTGAPLYGVPGYAVNPAAFVVPPEGEWGNAGRNTITGPVQFTLNGSLGRTFRLKDRYSLDLRFDVTNALNHVTFANDNTQLGTPQFGVPNPLSVNAMRDVITNIRLRF